MLPMLAYAVLGILARNAYSGYDLMHLLQLKVGAFWQARHSQIYPELARLEAQGLLTHEVIAQVDRPAKKVFSITEAGRAALRTWVELPMEPPKRRDEFLLKAFAIWLATPEVALAEFREHARQHREQQLHYEQLLAERYPGAVPQMSEPLFATYITVQRGISYEREYATWCEWVADLIEAQTKHDEGRETKDES